MKKAEDRKEKAKHGLYSMEGVVPSLRRMPNKPTTHKGLDTGRQHMSELVPTSLEALEARQEDISC